VRGGKMAKIAENAAEKCENFRIFPPPFSIFLKHQLYNKNKTTNKKQTKNKQQTKNNEQRTTNVTNS
jgi:hypothetical protein